MTFNQESNPHDSKSAQEIGGHTKRAPVDLERRRIMLRTLAAGLGAAALGSEQLAFGFLRRPDENDPPLGVCTLTTTMSESGSYTELLTQSTSFTYPNTEGCSGTSTWTVKGGDPHINTKTFTQTFGKPAQTITVSETFTSDSDPDRTLTIARTCNDGGVTMSTTCTLTGTRSQSTGVTRSATYTTPCGWNVDVPETGEHSFLGDPSEIVIDELDGRIAVLSSKSRRGRGEGHLTEL